MMWRSFQRKPRDGNRNVDPSPMVLLVDPEIESQRIMRQVLEAHCKIVTTRDVRGAVRVLGHARPRVMVCRQQLPDGDGLTLLQHQFLRGSVPAGVLVLGDDGTVPDYREEGRSSQLRLVPFSKIEGELPDAVMSLIGTDDAKPTTDPSFSLQSLVDSPWVAWTSRVWHRVGSLTVGLLLAFLGLAIFLMLFLIALYFVSYVLDLDWLPQIAWLNRRA